ncbi:negative regulator of differentiation 1 [Pseudovirgaria hyperparasitica]|uniref:Negative regulator of differentiation 1 n=1 Tax=Pseudovirgaria hyperparasitica TaxID=470096 RepID=A0A6A6WN58_9PEZI|nr:negative regulator of differentiation 1 [Pseudovirgaria hyperparasitica]KAF2763452.1 negative regulator of differentiation 1 [Pseudovirgaria hyperparasitica]
MQHQESNNGYSGHNGNTGPRHQNSFSKPAMNGDHTGFSHGAYHQNQHSMSGYGDRHPQRNIPAINTGRVGQHQNMNDMQTPGTAFDMNFTPLLPSQLLLGSPFQPGSPSAFTSPQFQNFSSFAQNAATQPQGQQNQMGSPLQQQTPLSPQMYNSMMSPNSMNAPAFFGGPQSPTGGYPGMGNQAMGGMGASMHMAPGLVSGTSRTVYLGNIPPETSAEEILGHVRSGQIESVRLLPDKNCAFISFLDSSSATHFHSDAILKKLSIRGQDIKIGWGKPSQVPTSVALAVQQSGASRNVYLGNLPEDVSEEELREDLGKFGPVDTVKIVREKAIGFVHFLSIGNAIKAVAQLPQEPKWQTPRRVYYGKDRCAYVSKTQQQNAAQYLGIAPGYAHVLNGADRDIISNALAQQSVAAAAVATSAGGVNNLGNRTVYLGNIHPETTIEEICNVVRGGLLHHIRYIPDKHICFVTFIDPTSAASFYALSNLQGLMIHNRRLKIGWGKHSGALPPAIALAVSGGASRNVYIGNLDESWSEERLRQDFAEYGEIELVNALREKSCAFVNFTNIANAIKAIEAIRGREEYKRFKVNFGKDRCGNPPRQINSGNQMQQNQQSGSHEGMSSPSPINGIQQNRSQTSVSPTGSNAPGGVASTNAQYQALQAPTASSILNTGANNPLMMYLHNQQQQHHQNALEQQKSQQASYTSPQAAFYGADASPTVQQPTHPTHNATSSVSLMNGGSTSSTTIGGMLAPSNLSARAQHARAVSLPVFSQGPFSQTAQQGSQNSFGSLSSGLGGFGGGSSGYGLAIQGDGGLPGWAEEEVEVGAQ